jgi:hypothetical protein
MVMSEKNALVPLGISPGSKPLKHSKWERYARYRAQALPRIVAFRKIGNYAANDKIAHNNASRLENKPGVKDRFAYLIRQEEELIVAKRWRIEEQLWAIAEGNLQNFFEPHEVIARDHTGQTTHDENGGLLVETRARPKLLTDLSPELAALIEDVVIDSKGRAIPRLYSKAQANVELRKMLNINAKEAPKDIAQLSDQELIATLAQQARELGIEIDLNYRFAEQPPVTETDRQENQLIDIASESDTPRKR